MKKNISYILLCGILVLSLTGCSKNKNDLQESEEKYGAVEKENVEVLVAKFNTEVNTNDKILTLSTCYKESDRVVLHAKLIKMEVKNGNN